MDAPTHTFWLLMARIEWTRLAGEDVEQVIAIMTRRERGGRRLRPSRGDRGIDILVPTDVPGVVNVMQVKKFAANLTPRQKAQIEESYDRLRKTVKERALRVRTWELVMPLDPTPENDEWFGELTRGAPFACVWCGLDYVDGLAAKYPEVIDYYLRDGKERLEAAVAALTKIITIRDQVENRDAEGGPLTPTDVVPGLLALHQELNRYDPHYRYDYSVDAERPEVGADSHLVFAAQISDEQGCVTFRVFALFPDATEERPIPINIAWRVQDDSEEADLLRDWMDFGTPISMPLGSADLDLDLPGGLGGHVPGAAVKLGPSVDAEGYELRAVVVDEEGKELASALLKMEPATQGVTGRGKRASGIEEHGVFSIEMRITPEDGLKASISASQDLEGRRPADLVSGLRFLSMFHGPNELRFASAYGPPLPNGIPLPERERTADSDLLLDVVEALSTIQRCVRAEVLTPDLSKLTVAQGIALIQAGQLLRGETVTTRWKRYPVVVKPEALAQTAVQSAFMIEESFGVRLGDREVPLGVRRVEITAARVEISVGDPRGDGLLDAYLVPVAGGEIATLRLVSGPPLDHQ
jgi:hypothetical protein